MEYREYPDQQFAYILHHTEGGNDPMSGEAPRKIGEIVGASDDEEEMVALGKKLYPRPTTWEWDGWTINVNTSTDIGKAKYAAWAEDSRKRFAYIEAHSEEYDFINYGENKIYFKKNGLLDDLINTSGNDKSMYGTMSFLIPSSGLIGPVAPIEIYTPKNKE